MANAELREAVDFLAARGPAPSVALILGSGFDRLLTLFDDVVAIPYRTIPRFPAWTGPDEARLIIGSCARKRVAVIQHRFQYCHGHTAQEIAFPLRALRLWGAEVLLLTNAAGGINPDYAVGDFVAITDHIDFTARNPLIGPNPEALGPRFADMSEVYDRGLLELCVKAAHEVGIGIKTGIYLGVTGPSYETPAEIRAFRMWGADLVGMSTVSEAIVARHMGQPVLAISLVTNQAAGSTPLLLTHAEVLRVAECKAEEASRLIRQILVWL